MSDPHMAHRAPQAVTRRSRRFSIIWMVPIVAVAIGAWLAWDTLSRQGPTITVTFDSAEGLQPVSHSSNTRTLCSGRSKA
jgi:paraquat-inducible protein B